MPQLDTHRTHNAVMQSNDKPRAVDTDLQPRQQHVAANKTFAEDVADGDGEQLEDKQIAPEARSMQTGDVDDSGTRHAIGSGVWMCVWMPLMCVWR